MRPYLTCLAALGLTLVVAGTGRANLITNGSFEDSTLTAGESATLSSQGFVTLYSPSTEITGWTVSGDSVDYIGSYWQAASGTHSIDLDGNGQGGLSASTTFNVVMGVTYQVQFAMAGNPDGPPLTKALTASAGGVSQVFSFVVTPSDTHSNMGWVTKSFDFTAAATGTTTLSFASNVAGFYGPALDNVIVTAVPEPATVAMCGTALLSVAGVALRRRAKAALIC
jgi:choice-of-anchor C domain-containing protein